MELSELKVTRYEVADAVATITLRPARAAERLDGADAHRVPGPSGPGRR